jgi:hypothetical protein
MFLGSIVDAVALEGRTTHPPFGTFIPGIPETSLHEIAGHLLVLSAWFNDDGLAGVAHEENLAAGDRWRGDDPDAIGPVSMQYIVAKIDLLPVDLLDGLEVIDEESSSGGHHIHQSFVTEWRRRKASVFLVIGIFWLLKHRLFIEGLW